MLRQIIFLIQLALLVLTNTAITMAAPLHPLRGEYPIKVVTTIAMLADIAQQIGGERVSTKSIMGQGVDPHTYKASPIDVSTMLGADLILANGLFLEGKMNDVLEKLGQKKSYVPVAERIDQMLLLKPAQFEGHYDPHIWMDPSLWLKVAQVIRDVLSELDSEHREEYLIRFNQLAEKMLELDRKAKSSIASIPVEKRVLVTAHDAFGYFGRAYNIEVKGIQGISTESEAGLKDINLLVDFLVARKIPAVFVESSVSEKNVRALVEGCRARGHDVVVGGELYSDAMGAPGTVEGTYLGMIQHNVRTIVGALGGTPAL